MRERDKLALGILALIGVAVTINALHCDHPGDVLDGVWRVESVQVNGQPPQRERELWVFRDGIWTIVRDGDSEEFRVSINRSAAPKHFDTDILLRRQGIYEVRGDTLRVAQVFSGAPRPTEFSTEWGDMRIVTVLRRAAADPQLSESALRELLVAHYGPAPNYPKRMEFDAEAAEFIADLMRDIYDKAGKDLTAKEEVVQHVSRLMSEVNNGGFHQYFYNATGDHALHTAGLLRRIGAPHTAALVEAGCGQFPNAAPPQDYVQRRAVLDRFTLDQLEALRDLQERYYARAEDLNLLLKQYWEAQP